ncbi:MAG: CHASE2 domain-containing protein, partial [Chromatiales bacterium]
MSSARALLRHCLPSRTTLAIGALVASLGVALGLTPLALDWEEDLGLSWLFRLRGPVTPPEGVVVVTIDRESSDRFGLPNLPRKWPRELHAQLVERLHELGAGVVVFDVLFHEPRDPEQDRRLAEALRASGKVILVEYLRKEILPGNGADAGAIIEQRVRPLPELYEAALATAPFT